MFACKCVHVYMYMYMCVLNPYVPDHVSVHEYLKIGFCGCVVLME